MRFLSVCSGIEAASVAWNPLGWKAAAFAEIEPFPCSVLAHHYPTVPNHGDMTRFQEWPAHAIDLLCGGTPCQSFSVAGLRKGLDDPRGNLMLTYGAIAARYRPQWLVWENVTGVLSSNEGRDFGTFLGMLGQLGYGFAYRVLDAQFFGVPQRRRRVFVVGCLGDWRRAAAVLFERHSLSGHPAPSREAGQGIDKCLTRGANQRLDFETEDFVTHSLRGEGFDASEDGTGRGTPLLPVLGKSAAAAAALDRGQPVSFTVSQVATGFAWMSEVAPTITATQAGGNANPAQQTGILRPISFGWQNSSAQGDSASEDYSPTLDKSKTPAVMDAMQVRRLIPEECEALQGFPRGYTAVPHRGKPAADGPRYKALGNSWAVPCARWIGQRIETVRAIDAIEEAA